jgi:replication factor C subunit 2/4
MIGNNALRASLFSEIVSGLSHCLFYGPPGSGKTTMAIAIARQLFPYAEDYKRRVLELNASKDFGIKVVREKIANFVKQKTSLQQCSLDPNNRVPLPPVRLVILDEADRMTHEAQAALRQMTEDYGKNGVRFFLLCNYRSDIIEPLVSRCLQVPFVAPPRDEIVARLARIAEVEGLMQHLPSKSDAKQILAHLAQASHGDMRQAMHWLQHLTLEQRASNEPRDKQYFFDRIDTMSASVPRHSLSKLLDILMAVPANGHYKPVQDTWTACAQALVLDRGLSVGKCFEQLSEALPARAVDEKSSHVVAEILYRLGRLSVALHSGGGDPTLLLYALYHSSVAHDVVPPN